MKRLLIFVLIFGTLALSACSKTSEPKIETSSKKADTEVEPIAFTSEYEAIVDEYSKRMEVIGENVESELKTMFVHNDVPTGDDLAAIATCAIVGTAKLAEVGVEGLNELVAFSSNDQNTSKFELDDYKQKLNDKYTQKAAGISLEYTFKTDDYYVIDLYPENLSDLQNLTYQDIYNSFVAKMEEIIPDLESELYSKKTKSNISANDVTNTYIALNQQLVKTLRAAEVAMVCLAERNNDSNESYEPMYNKLGDSYQGYAAKLSSIALSAIEALQEKEREEAELYGKNQNFYGSFLLPDTPAATPISTELTHVSIDSIKDQISRISTNVSTGNYIVQKLLDYPDLSEENGKAASIFVDAWNEKLRLNATSEDATLLTNFYIYDNAEIQSNIILEDSYPEGAQTITIWCKNKLGAETSVRIILILYDGNIIVTQLMDSYNKQARSLRKEDWISAAQTMLEVTNTSMEQSDVQWLNDVYDLIVDKNTLHLGEWTYEYNENVIGEGDFYQIDLVSSREMA